MVSKAQTYTQGAQCLINFFSMLLTRLNHSPEGLYSFLDIKIVFQVNQDLSYYSVA